MSTDRNEPRYPMAVETFRDPGYELRQFADSDEPTCFNGNVSVRKYRVSVEEIDEPVEVIHERLRKLWRESDNYHHRGPLQAVAKKYGLTLDHDEVGRDRKRRGR